uniref:Uncharacterized protein n=1 Tax=Eutreptiella gymnastica TaxID=73025 RepID=A0A7S4CVT9_9EUGL
MHSLAVRKVTNCRWTAGTWRVPNGSWRVTDGSQKGEQLQLERPSPSAFVPGAKRSWAIVVTLRSHSNILHSIAEVGGGITSSHVTQSHNALSDGQASAVLD